MAKQVQIRRGTTAQHASFTGAAGEVTANTTRKGLHVHDGSTAGGIIIPNAPEALNQTHRSGTAGGTGDAVTLTLDPVPSAYALMMKIKWVQPSANTGAATINVNGLGAVAIKKNGSTALSANDLLSGNIYEATHDGTNFQLGNAVSRGSSVSLIMASSPSSAAPVDLTGIDVAVFGDYEIRGWARPATDGTYPMIQYGTGGGPTYGTSGYSGAYTDGDTGTRTSMGSDDGRLLTGGTNPVAVGNDSGDRFTFRFTLGDLGTAQRRFMSGEMSWTGSESTGINYYAIGVGRYWSTSTAVTAIRFKFGSGNIAAGWLGLYGYLRA